MVAFITFGTSFVPSRQQYSVQLCSNNRRPSYRRPFYIFPPYPATALANPESETVSPSTTVTSTTSTPQASSSTSSSSSSSSGNSEFRHRFEDLRGADIEPVSATVARFNQKFMRPVPVVYRSVINEMLTTAHLAKVCAMWRFDSIFAFGFDSIFTVFLQYYPNDDERQFLYQSAAHALQMDIKLIESGANSVREWLDGKSEEDLFTELNSASPGSTTETVGPVIEALAYIRDAGNFDWYYSRLFGIGLIQIMDLVGSELSVANAEIWAKKIGLEQSKFSTEMATYISNMERLKQAEQIFAEAAAREAKKTADRLAEKAKAAAKQAEELEKDEEQVSTTDVVTESKSDESTESSEVEKSV